jgi:hypothetical protein
MKSSIKTLTLLIFLAIIGKTMIAQQTEVIQKAEAFVQLSSASGDSFRNEPLHKKMQPFRIIGIDNPTNDCKARAVENLASGFCVDNLYTSGCGSGDRLTSWELANINVPSIPCSGTPDWYLDYTYLVHEFMQGGTYALTVTAGYQNTHFAVWIDFDGNLELTPDELLLSVVCTEAGTAYNFDLTMPNDIENGVYTMRARTNRQNPATDPCATYVYGQAIDFTAFFCIPLPCIPFDPLTFGEIHHNPPEYSTQSMFICNYTCFATAFNISPQTEAGLEQHKGDSWLTVEPSYGYLESGETIEVTVGFNSAGLSSPGIYNGALLAYMNQSYNIPVTLELENCGLPPVENFTCAYTAPSTILLTWDSPQPDQQVLRWDDGNNYTNLGMPEGGSFTAAARWDATMMEPYHNWLLTHIAFFPTSADATFVVKAWIGEDLITSQPVMNITPEVWNEVELDTPVQIIGDQELSIGFEVTHPAGVSPAGCDAGPAVAGYGDLVNGGTLSGMGLDFNWNLAGYISPPATGEKALLLHQHNSKSELLAYNVYKNDVLIATLATNETTFVDVVFPGETPTYIIGAVYYECESMSDPCTPMPIAWMECVPESFNIALVQNETLTEELLIINSGHQNSVMNYQIEIQYLTPEDDWLSLTPASGQISGVSTDTVAMTITTTNLQIGEHKANLLITSNAHNQQLAEIPVVLDLITGISHPQKPTIHIYPNPTKGIVTIAGSVNFAKVAVFNAFGVEVYRGEQALPAQVDLTKQPRGVYLLKMEIESKILHHKIIIN